MSALSFGWVRGEGGSGWGGGGGWIGGAMFTREF